MTSATPASIQRAPELVGQTVVVIGGSAGIGLETARRARAEGADVILTGRNPHRLEQAALEIGAQSTAAFDANDAASLKRFFQEQPAPIDHVMVTAGGPQYGPLLEMDSAQVREAISDHVVLALEVARNAAGKMRPGGTLLLMGAPAAAASVTASGSPPPPPPRCRRSRQPSPSSSRRFASTSSPPASSTPRCRHRCSKSDSRSAAMSSGRRSRSAASSAPPTSPRSPSTS
jgi:NAD(P)-dependent dehydrogenase (short-subunit alcohol dehydrogenase family)